MSPKSVAHVDSHPEMVVFFIHGLLGDETSFCEFDQVLQKQVNIVLGREAILTQSIGYDTFLEQGIFGGYSKKGKSVRWFSHQIAFKIAKFFSDNQLDIETPYTLVMHSQGGLVGSHFARHCVWGTLTGHPQNCNTQGLSLPTQLVHSISIGTPFHGSPGANFLTKGITGLFPGFLLAASGAPNQISDLALGSTNLYEDRKFLAGNHSRRGWSSPFVGKNIRGESVKLETKFYNVVGNFELENLDLIAQLLIHDKAQTDLIVDVTSARQDFNYCIMESPSTSMNCGATNLVQPEDYYLVDLAHTMKPPLVEVRQSMQCVQADTPHPTLDFVRRVLLKDFGKGDDRSITQAPAVDQTLVNFSSDVHVFFPSEMMRGPEPGYLKIEIIGPDFSNQHDEFLSLNNTLANTLIGFNTHENEQATPPVLRNRLSFFHQGRIRASQGLHVKDGYTLDQATSRKIGYDVSHPGFENFKFYMDVQASKTNFSKLYLSPKRPTAEIFDEKFAFHGGLVTFNDRLKHYLNHLPHWGRCQVGVIAPRKPKLKHLEPPRYKNFSDHKIEFRHLAEASIKGRNYFEDSARLVRVLARFTSPDGKLDRYFILKERSPKANDRDSREKGHRQRFYDNSKIYFGKSSGWSGQPDVLEVAWMDVNDIDIRWDWPCPNHSGESSQ